MPSPIDKLTIPPQLDGRRKISDEQKQEVVRLREIENLSWNKIAMRVGISKRSVGIILNPEQGERIKQLAKECKRWEPYNTKEIRLHVMRKYRAKKRDLHKRGLIK